MIYNMTFKHTDEESVFYYFFVVVGLSCSNHTASGFRG